MTHLLESCSVVVRQQQARGTGEECRWWLHLTLRMDRNSVSVGGLPASWRGEGYETSGHWCYDTWWAQTEVTAAVRVHIRRAAQWWTWDLLSWDSTSKCHWTRETTCPSVDRHACPPIATLCQMSQNDCCDSQGRWENSSAAGLSTQMSPAVTLGASRTSLQKQSALTNTHSVFTVRCTTLTLKMLYSHNGCFCKMKWTCLGPKCALENTL